MKKTDIKILTQLRIDGRIPLTELAKKTGLPVSTIHDRIRQNIDNGVLKPSILLRFEKIGFTTRAYIFLSVEQAEKEKLLQHLKYSPYVNSLFRINNGWNVMMECVFKDMHSLEDFLELLESKFQIKQKQVHYVLDELKREGFLTQPELAEAMLKI